MFRFIVRRLLVTIPTILVVISITWVLIKLAPGNFYSGEKPLPPAIEKSIREKYGLDKPWYQQYGKTMWSIIRHLDFGTSLRFQGQSVNTIIKRSFPTERFEPSDADLWDRNYARFQEYLEVATA